MLNTCWCHELLCSTNLSRLLKTCMRSRRTFGPKHLRIDGPPWLMWETVATALFFKAEACEGGWKSPKAGRPGIASCRPSSSHTSLRSWHMGLGRHNPRTIVKLKAYTRIWSWRMHIPWSQCVEVCDHDTRMCHYHSTCIYYSLGKYVSHDHAICGYYDGSKRM